MAISNHERVGKALELLKAGVGPFVEREFQSVSKERAGAQAAFYLGEDRIAWGFRSVRPHEDHGSGGRPKSPAR